MQKSELHVFLKSMSMILKSTKLTSDDKVEAIKEVIETGLEETKSK